MLKLKTQNQITRIVNNIVAACKDITKLNKTGYGYIYLAGGFIAHNDLHGFITYYHRNSFVYDVVQNICMNRYSNFRPSDKDFEYYNQKAEIYRLIIKKLGEDNKTEDLQARQDREESWEESWDRAHYDMEI